MGRFLLGLLAVVAVAAAAFAVFAWRSAIDPIDPPQRTAFDQQLIGDGARLAAIGNCTACHTRPGGRSFAGGLPIPTPFGTIYSTNITPDPETGIGRWSEAAFNRAMRDGVDRGGRHLYPAFPYDHFTLVSDQDNKALYAFLMTRPAVEARAPANELPFPLNMRWVLAGWKLLFFNDGAYQTASDQSPEWNRGAYLVNGLGHCGSCHTPRNDLGAEESGKQLTGGSAEGWSAFALDAASPAPVPWTADALYAYMRDGWHPDHGVASGPMAEVTGNLGLMPDEDIRAIAVYVAARMGEPTAQRIAQGKAAQEAAANQKVSIMQVAAPAAGDTSEARGQTIYAAACAACHNGSRALPYGGVSFYLSSAIHAPDAQNAINTVLFGLPASSGTQSAVMPGFAPTMTDSQIADVLAYLRSGFASQPAWSGVEAQIANTRSGAFKVAVRPSDGIERGPQNIGAQDQ